jgi:hypothetical protein
MRSFLSALRRRPGMYLPARDWSYITAVAYLEGWFQGLGVEPGIGRSFSVWLGEPSIAWWSTIARRRCPDRTHPLSDIDAETDALLIDDLFRALDEFLASRQA